MVLFVPKPSQSFSPFQMLLDQEQLPSFYNDIVSLSLKERSPVLILVARDVDALCACRIFTVSERN